MAEFVLTNHKETDLRNFSASFTPTHTLAIQWLLDTFKIGKQPAEIIDLYSCHFLMKALR
jgi:hypothetical protein